MTTASGTASIFATVTPETPPEASAAPSAVVEAKMPELASLGFESEAAIVAAAPVLEATTSTETSTLPGETDTLTASMPTPAAFATTDAMPPRRAGV